MDRLNLTAILAFVAALSSGLLAAANSGPLTWPVVIMVILGALGFGGTAQAVAPANDSLGSRRQARAERRGNSWT